MSDKPSNDDVGDDQHNDGNDIRLNDVLGQPPSYESVMEQDEDKSEDEISTLLHGQAENGSGDAELSAAERKEQHDKKIKKLMADLHRDCSVEEVAPEEIEMLNIGDDGLSESDMSSVPSSARRMESAPDNTTESSADDKADASLMRLSRRLSMNELRVMSEPVDEANGDNDVDPPRDEASVEDGEDRPRKFGLLALVRGSPTRKLMVAGTVIFCLGLLLLVILLPKSFVYVEYHEYAMSRNTWTGKVDYSAVYDSGCYLLAPQDELVRLDATAHFIEQSLDIMDNTGLSINMDIALQYFLKREEVGQLYRRYHLDYNTVMASLVESAVKNVAVKFTLDQYRGHRQEVEATILKTVQRALAGDCCAPCCPGKCGRHAEKCDMSDCRPVGSCDKGHHVLVKYFQLGAITIPETVINRHIERIVLQVEADRELFYQQRAIEVKKTEQMAKNILNEAEELKQKARANDRAIRIKAEAEKNLIVERARQQALKKVFSHFNITKEETRLSYIYERTLAEKGDNLRFTYAYDKMSAFTP